MLPLSSSWHLYLFIICLHACRTLLHKRVCTSISVARIWAATLSAVTLNMKSDVPVCNKIQLLTDQEMLTQMQCFTIFLLHTCSHLLENRHYYFIPMHLIIWTRRYFRFKHYICLDICKMRCRFYGQSLNLTVVYVECWTAPL